MKMKKQASFFEKGNFKKRDKTGTSSRQNKSNGAQELYKRRTKSHKRKRKRKTTKIFGRSET